MRLITHYSVITVSVLHIFSTCMTWCGLSANLECMSEMCCTRLAGTEGATYVRQGDHQVGHSSFNWFRVLAALLHGAVVVGVSQTLRRCTEGATYVRQGGHHVGHWPTF